MSCLTTVVSLSSWGDTYKPSRSTTWSITMKLRTSSPHELGSLMIPGVVIGPVFPSDFRMMIEPWTVYLGGTSRVSAKPMLVPTATTARISHL